MSTLAVVEVILRDAAVPLSVREIVERAGPTLPTKSKTPDTVVARDLSMDIKKKGEVSLFIRTSPGRYAIREQVLLQQSASETSGMTAAPTVVATSSRDGVGVAVSNGASNGNGVPASAPTATPSESQPQPVAASSEPTPVLGQSLVRDRAPTRPAPAPSQNGASTNNSEEITA